MNTYVLLIAYLPLLVGLVFLLVFLHCLGACFFYAFKDIGRYKDYSRAVALYEAGD